MTGGVDWQHLSRDELNFQLSPSLSAKDAMGVLTRHEAETKAAMADKHLNVRADIAYGPATRNAYDVYAPAGATGPLPCFAFIHGGFWQEGSKSGSGFAARAFAANGWVWVGLGYTLCPEIRLGGIVEEIAAALIHLKDNAAGLGIDPSHIVLGGHSAGGHLTAAILSGMGGRDAAAVPEAALAISGVYDLAPIRASYVNDLVGMDDAEVAGLSPLFIRPEHDVPVHILIGGDETAAFQQQSRALGTAWRPHISKLSMTSADGRDHFDILDVLSEADGKIPQTVRAMV